MEEPEARETGGERVRELAGLGTPATRAEIIGKLFAREYIFERGKKLYAGDKGLFLLRQLRKDGELARIADAGRTTAWEEQLEKDPGAFEREVVMYIRACIKKDAEREAYERAAVGECPVCGKKVLEGRNSFYCAGYKGESACQFSIWKETSGAKVTVEDAAALLAGKKTGVKKCATKAGKSFSARFYLDRDKKVAFDFDDGKRNKRRSGIKSGKSL